MSILVIGSFMMDMVVRTMRAPEAGETVIGTSFDKFPGGKGANQAVAAARLGGKVIMAGKLGKDANGDDMRIVMERERIDIRHILVDESALTGVGSIIVDSTGQNRIIVVPGANMKFTPEELEDMEHVFKSADILILQLEMDMRVVERAAALAFGLGLPVILNPAPAKELSDDLLKHVTYLTPNETELEMLTGIKIHDVRDLEQAARKLLAKGVKHVVVTLADKGAFIATASESKMVQGFPVRPIDTVAAGDSFNGAMAVQLVQGRSLEDAVRYANAAGALTVTKPGAIPSLPNKEDVARFLTDQ